MMSARIPIAGPWITDKEIRYVSEAVANGWYANSGKYQGEFEQAFAAFTGRRYGIALPSCTAGLHLALMALGIGPGDEVIVPDVTWIATSAPISYVGATAVFADFDPGQLVHDRRQHRGGADAAHQSSDRRRPLWQYARLRSDPGIVRRA